MPKPKITPCKFRDPLLSTCTGFFAPDSCIYIDAPEKCLGFENGSIKPVKHNKELYFPPSGIGATDVSGLVEIKQENERLETPLDFVARTEEELKRIGVEYIEEKPKKIKKGISYIEIPSGELRIPPPDF